MLSRFPGPVVPWRAARRSLVGAGPGPEDGLDHQGCAGCLPSESHRQHRWQEDPVPCMALEVCSCRRPLSIGGSHSGCLGCAPGPTARRPGV